MAKAKGDKKPGSKRGKILKRELPPIKSFDKKGDFLEGQFTGLRGDGQYRTLNFVDGKGKKWGVWWKACFDGVFDQMVVGNVYRLELMGDIKTGSGRKMKDIQIADLS